MPRTDPAVCCLAADGRTKPDGWPLAGGSLAVRHHHRHRRLSDRVLLLRLMSARENKLMPPDERRMPAAPSPTLWEQVPVRVESAWSAAAAFCLWQTFGIVASNAFVFLWTQEQSTPFGFDIGILVSGLAWTVIFLSAESNLVVGGISGGIFVGGYTIGGPGGFYIFSLLGLGTLLLFATPILLRGTLLTRHLPRCDGRC